jgi:hypothetical protein
MSIVIRSFGGGDLVVGAFATPYVFVPLSEASDLQNQINLLTSGGTIWLEAGTYNSGDLTMTNNNVAIWGVSQEATILTGSVTIPTNSCTFHDLWIKGTGKAYGVKIFNASAGPNRNHFTKVRIGGTASSADGPTGPGVWLDGGILNVFDHCLIAFNGGDGVYINTTDPSSGNFTTNVNTFRDCTLNLNDGYGVKTALGTAGVGGEPTPAIAGMQQNVFIGGNIEDNALGAAYVQSSFWTRFDNVDFESSKNLGTNGWLIEGSNCTYMIVENCSFNSTGDTGRVFYVAGSGSCRFTGNRIIGQFTRMDVGVFEDDCYRCVAYNNALWDPTTASGSDQVSPRWINNRGQNRGWTA